MNLVSLDPNQNPYAGDAIATEADYNGLPSQDPNPAGNVMAVMPDPNAGTHSGILATLEDYGSRAIDAVESGASAAASAVESGAGKVYQGGKTVVGDVVGGAESVVGFGVSQIVILVAVVGIAIYFAGKSGGLRISV